MAEFGVKAIPVNGFGTIAIVRNSAVPEGLKPGEIDSYLKQSPLRDKYFVRPEGKDDFEKMDIKCANMSRGGLMAELEYKGARVTLNDSDGVGTLKIGNHELAYNDEETYGGGDEKAYNQARDAHWKSVKENIEASGLLGEGDQKNGLIPQREMKSEWCLK